MCDFRSAFLTVCAYLTFVIVGSKLFKAKDAKGRDLMPTIDPYALKFVYNIGQVMVCSYMAIEAFLIAYRNGYSAVPCNSYSVSSPPMVNVLYLFYLSKVFDFADTAFIIIGKKWEQLSFLHVYHHCTIFSFYWLNSRVNYDGDVCLTIILNGLIHSMMYTYYFVAMHTKVPKDWTATKVNKKTGKAEAMKNIPIAWKSLLTLGQLFQFCCMMSQAVYLLNSECKSLPNPIVIKSYLGYILSLFVLFSQFFVQSYFPKKDKKAAEDKKN